MTKFSSSDFKEYCLQFYRELKHPYSSAKKVSVNITDLETAVDVLDGVLSVDVKEKGFSGLKNQFYAAFNDYLRLPRNQIGSLCIATDKLSALIDPFLKKVAFHFLPNKTINMKHGKRIALWKTSNYADILEALKVISKSKIYKKTTTYWEKQKADLAILREGFTARQKGVHESRIHNLEELERIAHAAIGSYIVVCLHISKNPPIHKKLDEAIEKRRAIHLFEERVRSYPITGSLLSKREHLLIYKWRKEIPANIEGKKFLFMNRLAGGGPCFYWLDASDKEILTAWAKEILQASEDETARKNAIRYLIKDSTVALKLRILIENFDYYEDKEELSQYIRRFAKASDINVLIKLCSDKREEVALASQQIVSQMFPRINKTLKKLAVSKSPIKTKVLRLVVRNLANKGDLKVYRNFTDIKDKAEQIIYIHCLGEVGNNDDLKFLSDWVTKKRRNEILRSACYYSASRIANRLGMSSKVLSLINKRERISKIAAMEALTREGIGSHFNSLFSTKYINRFKLSNIILQIATTRDKEIIRDYLATAKLDYDVRDLVLSLCDIGDSNDFEFLFDLISQYDGKIEFQNHVRVADGMARICSKKQARNLRRCTKSPEFWSYILPEDNRAKLALPVKNIENQAFMRRVIAACLIEKADKKDIDLLKKLLHHYYKWIAYKAAVKLSRIGTIRDIDNLNQSLWQLDEEKLKYSDPALYVLCLLDKRFHCLD
ncbi:MAG: hypothetical protein GY774_05535 [Planctomycetes bacterium]|nr:hypothetical protein [Planctomycetota bacterium]